MLAFLVIVRIILLGRTVRSEWCQAGLEIANNTVAFATKIFPFATKISGEVAN